MSRLVLLVGLLLVMLLVPLYLAKEREMRLKDRGGAARALPAPAPVASAASRP
jgi:hypothetical protein